ncbi:MAG: C40 family peptidase [Phycisphaeraceae bacterium]|nr:C40 family peptidase [Phycisphaeraceae bacterium]
MATTADIILAARACVGAKFRHQGRDPRTGIDCVGLIAHVARSLGLPIVDRVDYGKQPDGRLIEHLESAGLVRIDRDPAPGDVMVFAYNAPDVPEHVAIRTDYGMVHSFAVPRKVVETVYADPWPARLLAVMQLTEGGA